MRTDVGEDVIATFAALEEAAAPLHPAMFPVLGDPASRQELQQLCQAAGRTLTEVAGGWLTGYDDSIADRLAADGIGVLRVQDRAVLALVLIHTSIVPRAQGRLETDDWCHHATEGVRVQDLALNRHITKVALQDSLRRLDAAGIINRSPRRGIVPGPQMRRLTRDRNERIWAHLTLAARPHGLLATALRRRLSSTPERTLA